MATTTPPPPTTTTDSTTTAQSASQLLNSATSSTQVIDPATSIFVFIGLTVVYFGFKYTMPEKGTALFVVYFILILVSQFILNIYLAKQICNSPSNVGTAAVATIIPWVIIFGLLNFLLITFSGWLIAFSNTIGYGIASIIGLSTLFLDKLVNNVDNVKTTDNPKLIKILLDMQNDPSTVINALNEYNVDTVWNKSIATGAFKNTLSKVTPDFMPPEFLELKKYIILKDLVSYFMWYLLTGILITSISYNYMLTAPCIQTPKQARQSAAKFLADKNQAQQTADAAKANAPVYKTDGK